MVHLEMQFINMHQNADCISFGTIIPLLEMHPEIIPQMHDVQCSSSQSKGLEAI